jgi:putative peptidoglycan lipid II flippase
MTRTTANTIVLTILNGCGQAAGFLLYGGIAAIFGATWETDAFFLALTIPGFFIGAAVNAIIAAYIPVITEYRINNPQALGRLIGSSLIQIFTISVIASIVTAFITPIILKLAANGLSPTSQRLALLDTVLLLPMIAGQSLAALMTATYNSNNQYWQPATTVIIRFVGTFAIIVLLKPILGSLSLPIGFIIGITSQVVLLALLWGKFAEVKIVFVRHVEPEITRSIRLTIPLILGSASLQLDILISRFLAARLPPGSVSILDYAYRISLAIVEFLTGGILLIRLTYWSEIVAQGHLNQLKEELNKTIRIVLFITLPFIVLFLIFPESIITILFQRGQFNATLAIATAGVFAFYLLGIPPDAINRTYTRLFLALKDTKSIGGSAVIRAIAAIILSVILMVPMGVYGLALADSLAIILSMLILILLASQKLGDTFSSLWLPLSKLIITSIGCGMVAFVAIKLMPDTSIWLKLFIVGSITMLTYLCLSWALKIQELNILLSFVKKPWTGRGE